MKNTKLLIWPLLSLILLGCNKPLPVTSDPSMSESSEAQTTTEILAESSDASLPPSSEVDTPITEHLFPYSYQSDTFPTAPLKDFLSDFNVNVTIPSTDVLKQHYYGPTIRSENYGTYFEIFHPTKGLSDFNNYVAKLKNDAGFITVEDEENYVSFADLSNEVTVEILHLDDSDENYGEVVLIYINVIDDFTTMTTKVWPSRQVSHYLASFGLENVLPQGLDLEYSLSYYRYGDDLDYNYMSISTSDSENVVIADYTNILLDAGWIKEGDGSAAVLTKAGTSLTVSFTHYEFNDSPSTIYITPRALKLAAPLPFQYDTVETVSFANEDQLVVKDMLESTYVAGAVEMKTSKADSTVNVGNIIPNNEKQFFSPILRIYAGQEVVINAGDNLIKAVIFTYDQAGESEEGIYKNALLNGIYPPASGYNYEDSKILIKAYGELESISFSPQSQTRLLSVSVYY